MRKIQLWSEECFNLDVERELILISIEVYGVEPGMRERLLELDRLLEEFDEVVRQGMGI
ncbi:MAG: hypothetical protein AB7T49_14675 [Oligoflexales bacterium]